MGNKIEFNDGYNTYDLPNGNQIRINTTDFGICSRANAAADKTTAIIESHKGEAESMDLLGKMDAEIRAVVNGVFGEDVCTKAFGAVNCMSPVGGIPIVLGFLNAVLPIIERDMAAEKDKMQQNIKKYTDQVVK